MKSGGPFNSVKHLEVIYPYHFRQTEDCPSIHVYKFLFIFLCYGLAYHYKYIFRSYNESLF